LWWVGGGEDVYGFEPSFVASLYAGLALVDVFADFGAVSFAFCSVFGSALWADFLLVFVFVSALGGAVYASSCEWLFAGVADFLWVL
jgi:hypothetical protein